MGKLVFQGIFLCLQYVSFVLFQELFLNSLSRACTLIQVNRYFNLYRKLVFGFADKYIPCHIDVQDHTFYNISVY